MFIRDKMRCLIAIILPDPKMSTKFEPLKYDSNESRHTWIEDVSDHIGTFMQ